MKKLTFALVSLLVLAGAFTLHASEEAESWTGEIVDIACYVPKGASGEGHAACARNCVKNGQPMGLLTEDGTVILLAANHKDGAPYEGLKEHAGSTVNVTGALAEKGGMKIISVTAFEAAS